MNIYQLTISRGTPENVRPESIGLEPPTNHQMETTSMVTTNRFARFTHMNGSQSSKFELRNNYTKDKTRLRKKQVQTNWERLRNKYQTKLIEITAKM